LSRQCTHEETVITATKGAFRVRCGHDRGHPGPHNMGGSVPEMVHHPLHYGGDTTYEHVKVMKAWGMTNNAFLYNCTKYLCRFGKKDNRLEDLEKAKWYLEQAILEESEANPPIGDPNA